MDNSSGGGFGTFFVVVLVALLVAVGVFAYRSYVKESKEERNVKALPGSVQHVVAQMDAATQNAFFAEYLKRKRRTYIAYLCFWPLLGTHYFYVGKAGMNVLYWITGGGFGIWALVDLFRMPAIVRAENDERARQAIQTLSLGHGLTATRINTAQPEG